MKASSVEPAPAATVVHIRRACGFLERAQGLLARPAVAPGCGLLLPGVKAVHGFGMRRAIDLVFLDEQGTVVRCLRLAPWRIARCAAASAVLEMRAGDAERLRLRAGGRVELRPVADIFRQPPADPAVRRPGREAERPCPGDCGWTKPNATRRCLGMGACLLLLASSAVTSSQDAIAAGAGSSARPASGAAAMAGSTQDGALDAPTLRRFEAEADALYRDSAPQVADAELVRLYEVLATAAPRRRSHAWLRIGNIHQRAGAVGAAMDAYRKALHAADGDAQPAGAEASRRKALLNLASLALEQARLALASLPPSLPAAGDHVGQLETLSRQLDRLSPRHPSPPQPVPAPTASSREAAYVVERYTASARRNAVKAAKGSLQVDRDGELPARPLSRPRSRARERLPDVEYLLGDPQRSQATNQGREAKGAGK